MADLCPRCGLQLSRNGVCLNTQCDYEGGATALAPVKAPLPVRMKRAGAEVLAMGFVEGTGLLLVPFTLGLSSMLASLLNALYMGAKDMDGGRYGMGRWFGGTRLVDAETGKPATNKQALLRNSYLILGWAGAILPDPIGTLFFGLVGLMMMLDLGMAVMDPEGRRLGDHLARTKVAADD